MKKHLVIHHKADADGWFSGCLIARCIRSGGWQCDLMGIDYNEPEPDINSLLSYDEVHITDFTLSPEWMTEWYMRWPNPLWFDHHIGPIQKSLSMDYYAAKGKRCQDYSATMLVVQQLYPQYVNVDGFKLIDVADLHKKDDPNMFKRAMDAGAWYRLNLNETSVLQHIQQFLFDPNATFIHQDIGRKIRDAEEASAKRAKPLRVTFFGEEFPAVNTYHNSLAYDERFANEKAIIMFTIHGNLVKMSLRSIAPDYSVRGLCERLGGGGHERASGCEISINYFYNAIIK